MIFTRSENTPRFSHYAAYRDNYLRPDFQYRCAYCLIHEFYFQSGDGGEIDHFRPRHPSPALRLDFSHLANEYSNLYWSCGKCNRCKGNQWPTDADATNGFRFLDPCVEDHDAHWETRPDGTLISKTNTGWYTIRMIRLDRPRLNELRRFLSEYQRRVDALEQLLASKNPGPEFDALEAALRDTRLFLRPPVFEP